jgi:hypothetical protein
MNSPDISTTTSSVSAKPLFAPLSFTVPLVDHDHPTACTPILEVRLLGSPGARWLPTTWNLDELLAWVPGTCYEATRIENGLLLHISNTTTTLQIREVASR